MNENVRYESKLHVYLDGGPPPNAPISSAGLEEGYYVFQVTDPSGAVLLSEDPAKCRVVYVSSQGVITQLVAPSQLHGLGLVPSPLSDTIDAQGTPCHVQDPADGVAGPAGRHDVNTDTDHGLDGGAIVVQLMPFLDTPNNGGEYKAWMMILARYVANGGELDQAPKPKTGRRAYGFQADPGFGPARDQSKTDNFKVNDKPTGYIVIEKFNDKNGNQQCDEGEALPCVKPDGVLVSEVCNPKGCKCPSQASGWRVFVTDPTGVTNVYYTAVTLLARPYGQWKIVEDTGYPGWMTSVALVNGMSYGATAEVTLNIATGDCETHMVKFGNKQLPPTTASPTTASPTTASPTTASPTTASPTTASPTTASPTTASPTTASPTTASPTTASPTTASPTTASPTTASPTTASPTTASPTTASPTTASPTTASPTTASPTSASPTSASPTSASPTSASPTSASPTSASPTSASPTSASPTSASPTSASPTSASPTSASPTSASPTSASPTSVAPTTTTTTTPKPTTTTTTPKPTTTTTPKPTTTTTPKPITTTTPKPTTTTTTTTTCPPSYISMSHAPDRETECIVNDLVPINQAFLSWLENHGDVQAATDCCLGHDITWDNDYDGTGLELLVCIDVVTVTFTATDLCGSSKKVTLNYKVSDTKAPTVVSGDSITIACTNYQDMNAEYHAWVAVHGGATCTDDCSGSSVTWTDTVGEDRNLPRACGLVKVVDFNCFDRCGYWAGDWLKVMVAPECCDDGGKFIAPETPGDMTTTNGGNGHGYTTPGGDGGAGGDGYTTGAPNGGSSGGGDGTSGGSDGTSGGAEEGTGGNSETTVNSSASSSATTAGVVVGVLVAILVVVAAVAMISRAKRARGANNLDGMTWDDNSSTYGDAAFAGRGIAPSFSFNSRMGPMADGVANPMYMTHVAYDNSGQPVYVQFNSDLID